MVPHLHEHRSFPADHGPEEGNDLVFSGIYKNAYDSVELDSQGYRKEKIIIKEEFSPLFLECGSDVELLFIGGEGIEFVFSSQKFV